MSLLRRLRGGSEDGTRGGERILVVGLGNPGPRYAETRHNLGARIAEALASRWGLPEAKKRYAGLIAEGRAGPVGPRVALLLPRTYMNESGSSAGPARGALKVPLERIVVLHDEIDLPFGEVRAKLGGGVAGHNGLKSLKRGLGGEGFWRVRAGVGRPESTDPEVVSAYVLSRFREPADEVEQLIERAVDEAERLVERISSGEPEER